MFDDLTLTELFTEADRIGDQYLSLDEISERSEVLNGLKDEVALILEELGIEV
jgi:hypothetical protein